MLLFSLLLPHLTFTFPLPFEMNFCLSRFSTGTSVLSKTQFTHSLFPRIYFSHRSDHGIFKFCDCSPFCQEFLIIHSCIFYLNNPKLQNIVRKVLRLLSIIFRARFPKPYSTMFTFP
jgi:hypothetical protein